MKMQSKQVLGIVRDRLAAIVMNTAPVQMLASYASAPTDAADITAPVLIPEVTDEAIISVTGQPAKTGFIAKCARTVYVQGFVKVPESIAPSDVLDDLTEQVRLALLTIPKTTFQSIAETECRYILPESGSNLARVSLAYEINYLNQIGG